LQGDVSVHQASVVMCAPCKIRHAHIHTRCGFHKEVSLYSAPLPASILNCPASSGISLVSTARVSSLCLSVHQRSAVCISRSRIQNNTACCTPFRALQSVYIAPEFRTIRHAVSYRRFEYRYRLRLTAGVIEYHRRSTVAQAKRIQNAGHASII
jgi:hypothetical protein